MIEIKDLQKSHKTGTTKTIENQKFETILNYIAPKGVVQNGTVQFEIKDTLINKKNTPIRTRLSANASFILDKKAKELTIKKTLLQFDPKTDKSFVKIKKITKYDNIKIWNQIKNTALKK